MVHFCGGLKICLCRTRTEGQCLYSKRPVFLSDRFRKRCDKCLCCRICRHKRDRLKSRGGRNINDRTTSPSAHSPKVSMRQGDQRTNIQVDHAHFVVEIELRKITIGAKASIVYQPIYLK